MSESSFFLFARPSFLDGFSRAFDLGNTLNEYNRAVNGEQADFYALLGDWLAIEQDFRQALSAQIAAHEQGVTQSQPATA